MKAEKEKSMPLVFEGVKLDCGYRIDILVENSIVIELKSVEALNDVHLAQNINIYEIGRLQVGVVN